MFDPLFVVKLKVNDEEFEIKYSLLEACLTDDNLKKLFNGPGAEVHCSIWSGDLRLTSDIKNWEQLKAQIVKNSSTILRRYL